MATIMSRLRDEHANVEKLLKVAEHQADAMARGETPDYDLLEDIVEYFLAYPEAFHHPLEDLIYERLAAVRPDQREAIGDLSREHARLTESTHEFANLLRLIEQDGAVSQHDFTQMVRQFVHTQRAHMEKEEKEFFPAAEEALASADWNALDIRAEGQADPVFGRETEARFMALRDRIISWHEAAG